MTLIKIYNGKRNIYKYRKQLRKMGFRYNCIPEPHWHKDVADEQLAEIEEWCFKRKLAIVTPFTARSNDYRKRFFEVNPGNLRDGVYFCVYCGKTLSADKVSVDHLISVKKAQTSKRYLNYIRKCGYESVNDVRNLFPACKKCNSRKGSKGGLWVLKGRLGNKKWFWLVVKVLRVVLLVVLAVILMLWVCLSTNH